MLFFFGSPPPLASWGGTSRPQRTHPKISESPPTVYQTITETNEKTPRSIMSKGIASIFRIIISSFARLPLDEGDTARAGLALRDERRGSGQADEETRRSGRETDAYEAECPRQAEIRNRLYSPQTGPTANSYRDVGRLNKKDRHHYSCIYGGSMTCKNGPLRFANEPPFVDLTFESAVSIRFRVPASLPRLLGAADSGSQLQVEFQVEVVMLPLAVPRHATPSQAVQVRQ